MRKRFDQQLSIGAIPISEVKINLKTRHQSAKILLGLQYLFTHPELSEAAFEILEEKVLSGKKETGRLGMSLWEILVLGVMRLSLDIDYDFLLDQANNHEELRGILGVGKSDFTKGKEYKYQTVLDNVRLLDEQTIKKINGLVVKAGHQLIKKKEGVVDNEMFNLEVKVDSFVVETNVHFPTDLNLLWDSGRKSLDMIGKLEEELGGLPGWREREDWYRKLRGYYRTSSEVHRKKGKKYKSRLKTVTGTYLECAQKIKSKLAKALKELEQQELSIQAEIQLIALRYYSDMLNKHIDLVERRIITGEKIPHKEKVFSIFEPHTCWVSKGKSGKPVELGVPVVIATDQYQFILDHELMYDEQEKKKKSDTDMTQSIGESIKEKFKDGMDEACSPTSESADLKGALKYDLSSISYDRGFYSGPAKAVLEGIYGAVIMPKPGKKSLAVEQAESQVSFKLLKKKHSTIEANINYLEQHGADRCPDKGLDGMKRYVALGVLSCNLQQLGKLLMQQQIEAKKSKARKTKPLTKVLSKQRA